MPRLSDLLGLRPGGGQGIAPYGVRHDGLGAKGNGYMGALMTSSGDPATEYSIGVDIGGREMDVPSLVPTLTPEELQAVLRGQVTPEVAAKARAFAMQRVMSGQSPFAGPMDARYPVGAAGMMGAGPVVRGGIPGVNGAMPSPSNPGVVMPGRVLGDRG